MPTEPLRILLVDDHPLVRNGLRALLASVPETVVVGEAANGEEAIAQAAELQPDTILMDLHMPGLNGVEATRRILQVSPHVGVLVLTMLEDDASVFAAMRAGARGYLLKGADQAEILSAITAHEILGLIAIGKSNAEIAEELVLSPKTMSNHVSNIFSKLRVVDRAQAVLRAKQAGLGKRSMFCLGLRPGITLACRVSSTTRSLSVCGVSGRRVQQP